VPALEARDVALDRVERHLAAGARDVGEGEQPVLVGAQGHPLREDVVARGQEAGRAR
jgi:hypothetical protein